MIHFECDYTEGACPEVLARLTETNLLQTAGYGEDEFCAAAAGKIRSLCAAPDAAVHFLVGGTQTNATVISAALRGHEGPLCAVTGHINCHETGAVEATGHKVLTVPSEDGKIRAAQIAAYVEAHANDAAFEHMVKPGMVYISHPTENGTLYSLAELEEISAVCRRYGLYLFLDGARLGYGLAAPGADVTLPDLARLTDVFYIGGTKVGALFGEAVVITNDALKKDFRYFIKRHGGMLAKGRLLGVQFDALMTDGLYLRVSEHAVSLAMKLRAALERAGFPLAYDSLTNQQFPVVPDALLEKLSKKYSFSVWGKPDAEHTTVRFCTSWATREEDVDALIADIGA
jgi:threonine aldolase